VASKISVSFTVPCSSISTRRLSQRVVGPTLRLRQIGWYGNPMGRRVRSSLGLPLIPGITRGRLGSRKTVTSGKPCADRGSRHHANSCPETSLSGQPAVWLHNTVINGLQRAIQKGFWARSRQDTLDPVQRNGEVRTLHRTQSEALVPIPPFQVILGQHRPKILCCAPLDPTHLQNRRVLLN
jgi:hypothetical protein